MAGSPAPDTFVEMVGRLRLYVPQLSIFLAEEFIRSSYQNILDRRQWGGLRSEGEFLLNDAKTGGTVTATRNSNAVLGVGTDFQASDIGRQFKTNSASPIYTITAVADVTHLTLDRVFGGATTADATYKIFDGYVTVPSDFLSFNVVLDPTHGWRIRHWATQELIISIDPQRNSFGQPVALVDRRFGSVGASIGLPQYEVWPYVTDAVNLPYFYNKRGANLVSDTDAPIWPIRGDLIEKSAKQQLCLWPGTPDAPNPMFGRIDIYDRFGREYEDSLMDAIRQDEEIYNSWLETQPWAYWPVAPLSANWMQSHAV